MKRQIAICSLALSAAVLLATVATAADLTDVGFVDQADIANLPAFVAANRQLASYKSQLDAQYNSQVRHAGTDADKQRITMQFQQQFNDKQQEIVGPLYQRLQLAVAAVSGTRNLSIVVDKRIVIYGGQDITRDVETIFTGPQAISAPSASPPPSEIGFVDQNVLDGLPRVQTANSDMSQFESTQRQLYASKLALARSPSDKQQVLADFNKSISDRQNQILKPLVDQTKSATANVARKKNLVLIVDRADVIYGGTDITTDVQTALTK